MPTVFPTAQIDGGRQRPTPDQHEVFVVNAGIAGESCRDIDGAMSIFGFRHFGSFGESEFSMQQFRFIRRDFGGVSAPGDPPQVGRQSNRGGVLQSQADSEAAASFGVRPLPMEKMFLVAFQCETIRVFGAAAERNFVLFLFFVEKVNADSPE